MPGSSLWLLPPSDDPLNAVLFGLIQQTSSRFQSPHSFLPHVTLTSEISPASDPQAWLDSLELPAGKDVQVKFETLVSEDVFVRKLYIQCAKSDGLKKLAGASRRNVAGLEDQTKLAEWTHDKYNPHLSLLYHDCPKIDPEGISEVGGFVQQAGITLGEGGLMNGWTGGKVVLVQTDKPIDQWTVVAERRLSKHTTDFVT
ncbi:2',3'-cyclic-nucleotide 3'-phosphodiesterase [Ophiobolus disseminans]|uniref:2',3'-cyclic-nucleotide 3'-phosphodiesterase n=1 Tax=Ophiobolus disseminans TaxID=1469910 RepID=A0A6A7AKF9_9PLEO|nr:2',3'-cyclic-nucleotide 3'-phosphodiesterase [Ophiobolus disseminans]